MGKYNISVDEIKDIKKELNKQSSNGGEVIKEYYYRLNTDDINNNNYNMVMEMYAVGSTICTLRADDANTWPSFVKATPFTQNVFETFAIHLIDIVDYLWIYNNDNGTNNMHHGQIIPRGNIVDKLKYFAEENGMSQEAIQDMIDEINWTFQEITKEEYESMITYKPE